MASIVATKTNEPSTPAILTNVKKAFESERFKSDVRRFLAISDDTFENLVTRMTTAREILGETLLKTEIRNAGVDNDANIQLLARIIPIFVRWGRTTTRDTRNALMPTLYAALHNDFSPYELRTLMHRFTTLLEDNFPGLALADKCTLVARATGRGLRNAQLITNVRPVFDDRREQILAFVPITTLRLTTESPEENAPAETWEVQLSESELQELSVKLAEAQQKLSVIKQLFSEKNVELTEFTASSGNSERE